MACPAWRSAAPSFPPGAGWSMGKTRRGCKHLFAIVDNVPAPVELQQLAVGDRLIGLGPEEIDAAGGVKRALAAGQDAVEIFDRDSGHHHADADIFADGWTGEEAEAEILQRPRERPGRSQRHARLDLREVPEQP